MITIISPHMGSNALGRALVLAQVAESMGEEVRIVGSTRPGDEVWAPMRPYLDRYGVETFPLYRTEDYPRAVRALRALLMRKQGAVIISKPLPTSLGIAMGAGVNLFGKGVILDIDDWELGFRLKGDWRAFQGPVARARMIIDSVPMKRMNTDVGVWCGDVLARRAPHKIVSNSWLQRRFGGVLLPHVRSAEQLRPQGAVIRENLVRQELDMDEQRLWIGFIGTPRVHKGIGVLIEALAMIPEERRPGLALFGCSSRDEVSRELWEFARTRLGDACIRRKEGFAFDELAEHVAAVDVIVIPSLETTESVGQIPAKLFDAMAMAKPVIVSDVNDMGEIVAGSGVVVDPGDARSLCEGIEQLVGESVEQRARRGEYAREKFLERYELSSGARALRQVLEASWR